MIAQDQHFSEEPLVDYAIESAKELHKAKIQEVGTEHFDGDQFQTALEEKLNRARVEKSMAKQEEEEK